MSCTLQVSALLPLLTALIILATPSDDGAVAPLSGGQAAAMLFFSLLALAVATVIAFVPQFWRGAWLVRPSAVLPQGRTPFVASPLLC